MTKKIGLLFIISMLMMVLCSCDTIIKMEQENNNIKFTITLDESIIKFSEKDIDIFEANDFELSEDSKSIITRISLINFDDEFSNKLSLLKQIILNIDPSLESQVNQIVIEAKKEIKGFWFAGVSNFDFTLNSGDIEIGSVEISGNFNDDWSMGNIKGNLGEETQTLINYNKDLNDEKIFLDIINNKNIKNIEIKTDVKDAPTSKFTIYFNEPLDESFASIELNKNRASDINITKSSATYTIEYTSPEMFNALHSADIYNLTGGLYLINMDYDGVYTKKGSISVNTIDNGGIDDIVYSASMDNKEVGRLNLSESANGEIDFKSTNTGNIAITATVVISIGFVICIIVYLFKRK